MQLHKLFPLLKWFFTPIKLCAYYGSDAIDSAVFSGKPVEAAVLSGATIGAPGEAIGTTMIFGGRVFVISGGTDAVLNAMRAGAEVTENPTAGGGTGLVVKNGIGYIYSFGGGCGNDDFTSGLRGSDSDDDDGIKGDGFEGGLNDDDDDGIKGDGFEGGLAADGEDDDDDNTSSTATQYQKDLIDAFQNGYPPSSEGVEAYNLQKELDDWQTNRPSNNPTMGSPDVKLVSEVTDNTDTPSVIDDQTVNLNDLDNSLTGIANLADTLATGSYEIKDHLNGITNANITVYDNGESTITTTAWDGSTVTAKTSDNFSSITAVDTYGTTITEFDSDGEFVSASVVSADGEDVSLSTDLNNDGLVDHMSISVNNDGLMDSTLSKLDLGDKYKSSVTIGTDEGNITVEFESDDFVAGGELESTVSAITSNLQGSSSSDLASIVDDLDLDNYTGITTQEAFTTESGVQGTLTKEYGTGLDWDRYIPDMTVDMYTDDGLVRLDLSLVGELTGLIADKAFDASVSDQAYAAVTAQTIADVSMALLGGTIVESVFGADIVAGVTQYGLVGDISSSINLIESGTGAVQALGAYQLVSTLTGVADKLDGLSVFGDDTLNSFDSGINFDEYTSNSSGTPLLPVETVPTEYAYTVGSVYSSIHSDYVGALETYNITIEEVNTAMVIQNIQQVKYAESRKVDLSGQDPYSNFAGGISYNIGMAGSEYVQLEPVSVGDILFDENTSRVDRETDLVVNKGKTKFSDAGGLVFMHSLYPEAFASKLDLESIVNIDTKETIFDIRMLQELQANSAEFERKMAEYNNEVNRLNTLMPLLNAAIEDYKVAAGIASTTSIEFIESTIVLNSDNTNMDLYQRVNPIYQEIQDKFNSTLTTSAEINSAIAEGNYDLAEELVTSISNVDYLTGIEDITVTDDDTATAIVEGTNTTTEITEEERDMTGWELVHEGVATLT
ncbi:MAG: hypothetical protein U9Q66_03730 [Patescibacteria group bacterium]|nr:hypothetical protein [Patescibacteria group bacterium]